MASRQHVTHAKAGAGKTMLVSHLARRSPAIRPSPASSTPAYLTGASRWKRGRVIFIATDMGEGAEENTNTYLDRLHMAGLPFLQQVEWWLQEHRERASHPGPSRCIHHPVDPVPRRHAAPGHTSGSGDHRLDESRLP